MTATESVPEPQSVKADTSYLIFAKEEPFTTPDGPKPRWLEVGKVLAKSAEAAVKKHAESNRPPEGKKATFVAVAAARWTPVVVSEVVKRELVIGS